MSLELGAKVRHRKTQKIGLIVPESPAVGGDGVFVVWDGSSSHYQVSLDCLEFLDKPIFNVVPEKCRDCAFYCGANGCMRCSPIGMVILLKAKGAQKIPTRIYPYCAEGVGAKNNA